MGEGIINKTTLYIEKEDVEGVYKAPTASASAISAQEDGANDFVMQTKEALERTNLNASLGKDVSRTGIKSASGTIPLEVKAGDSEAAPEYAPLVESALGAKEDATLDLSISSDEPQVDTLTFSAQSEYDDEEFFVFYDEDGTPYGIYFDVSGTASAPDNTIWNAIHADNKKEADISAQTTDAEVATVVETAIGTITDIATKITVSRIGEVITLTQVSNGLTDFPVSYNPAASADGNVAIANVTLGGSTDKLIKMDDTTGLALGDIVVIKNAAGGILHVSPIVDFNENASIELLVAYSDNFEDSVTVKKMLTYKTADADHPSLSITKYTTANDVSHVEESATGCKVATMALENFSTGQQPTWSFAYEGIKFDRKVNNPAHTPSYDDSMPIIALCVGLYQNGVLLEANEMSLSLENTMGFRTTVTSCDGRTASRVTDRNITGTIMPYKHDNNIAQYERWLNDNTFSLFAYAFNPDENNLSSEIVAIYLPECQFTEIAQSDLEGLAQDSLSFAVRKSAIGDVSIGFC